MTMKLHLYINHLHSNKLNRTIGISKLLLRNSSSSKREEGMLEDMFHLEDKEFVLVEIERIAVCIIVIMMLLYRALH